VRVLFHFDPSSAVRERLRALQAEGIEVDTCPESDDAALRGLLPTADVLWHVLKPVTDRTIAAGARLRLIQKLGIGVNTIDLDAARARGVRVCNTPGANSRAVAEMTLALMLAAMRRIGELHTRLRARGEWDVPQPLQDRLTELGGKTIGLIGFGGVPQLLAPWLTAMGARVVYYARTDKAVPHPRLSLDELLATSDVVSLHLPLAPDTQRMLDARAFARMKRGSVLVNTARGGLLDEAALVDALSSGRVGAAGLDVFALEPIGPAHPLLAFDQVVATPHVAWLTVETLDRCIAMAIENCRALRDGRALANVVA
jgi:phosphoglycerate dehydrogenase-like enzyme